MSGCRSGLFNTQPSADWGKTADGREVLLDTDRNWRAWREGVDRALRTEIAGMKAPGHQDWEEFWSRELSRIQVDRDNAPKYVAYIIDSRRRAGLPELKSYPPSAGV